VKRQKWCSLRRQASSAERNLALRATFASLVGYRATDSRLDQTFLNGHDPYLYLKDVLTKLPTHKARDIDQLLPHLWQTPPASST
jgi:hypothetical protein